MSVVLRRVSNGIAFSLSDDFEDETVRLALGRIFHNDVLSPDELSKFYSVCGDIPINDEALKQTPESQSRVQSERQESQGCNQTPTLLQRTRSLSQPHNASQSSFSDSSLSGHVLKKRKRKASPVLNFTKPLKQIARAKKQASSINKNNNKKKRVKSFVLSEVDVGRADDDDEDDDEADDEVRAERKLFADDTDVDVDLEASSDESEDEDDDGELSGDFIADDDEESERSDDVDLCRQVDNATPMLPTFDETENDQTNHKEQTEDEQIEDDEEQSGNDHQGEQLREEKEIEEQQQERFDGIPSLSRIYRWLITNKAPGAMLYGAGGAGKSFLIGTFINQLALEKIPFRLTATTGTAADELTVSLEQTRAQVLPDIAGPLQEIMTLSSFLCLGALVNKTVEESGKIIQDQISSGRYDDIINELSNGVLIVDEISMLGAQTFDIVVQVLQRAALNLNKKCPAILVVGDFWQLPPVSERFCFTSPTFDKVIGDRVFQLPSTNLPRFAECKEWGDLLSTRIRMGQYDHPDVKKALMELKVVQPDEVDDQIMSQTTNNSQESAVLMACPTNFHCAQMNTAKHAALKAAGMEEHIFTLDIPDNKIVKQRSKTFYQLSKIKEGNKEGAVHYAKTVQMLRDRANQVLADHRNIRVCLGEQVMLVRNIDVKSGIVNGKIGIITKFTESGKSNAKTTINLRLTNGKDVTITTAQQHFEDPITRIRLTAIYYPIIPATSITFHNLQGKTLPRITAHLRNRNGQSLLFGGISRRLLYVALSRARRPQDITLVGEIDFEQLENSPDDELLIKWQRKIDAAEEARASRHKQKDAAATAMVPSQLGQSHKKKLFFCPILASGVDPSRALVTAGVFFDKTFLSDESDSD